MQPEPRCLLWSSTSADEKSEDMIIRTAARENRLPFLTKFKILGHCFHCEGKMQDCVEERMQCANKARWRNVKIYRSKDVPWRVKCRRMVEQVCSVFCFGSENGCWSQAVVDRIKGRETKVVRTLLRMRKMEDETMQGYCVRTARTARPVWK